MRALNEFNRFEMGSVVVSYLTVKKVLVSSGGLSASQNLLC
jgi:hypothetical protein